METKIKAWACQTFALTEQRYANFQYSQGLTYLESTFSHDSEMREAMEASKTFWSWWRKQWTRRDQRLKDDLEQLSELPSSADLDMVYMATHDVVGLGHPNAIILQYSLTDTLKSKTA